MVSLIAHQFTLTFIQFQVLTVANGNELESVANQKRRLRLAEFTESRRNIRGSCRWTEVNNTYLIRQLSRHKNIF